MGKADRRYYRQPLCAAQIEAKNWQIEKKQNTEKSIFKLYIK